MAIMVTTNYTFSFSKIFGLLPSSVACVILSQIYMILRLLTNL